MSTFNIESDTIHATTSVDTVTTKTNFIETHGSGSVYVTSPLVSQEDFDVSSGKIATFGGNIIAETSIYMPNFPQLSKTHHLKEVAFDTSFGRLVTRPTQYNQVREMTDRFEYVSADWLVVPSVSIGDPVFDAVSNWLSYPAANDTIGSILSNYIWRIRMNNTNDVYCYNMTYAGMYLYVPSSAATSRNYHITRPFACTKGSGNGGFEAEFRIGFATRSQTSPIFVGLIGNNANTFSLDGANTLSTVTEAIGFLINYSVNTNYNIILYVKKANVATTYQTSTEFLANIMYNFKITWDYDNTSNLLYTYGDDASYNVTAINTFSSNPATSNRYDPCIAVNRAASTTWGMALNKISITEWADN